MILHDDKGIPARVIIFNDVDDNDDADIDDNSETDDSETHDGNDNRENDDNDDTSDDEAENNDEGINDNDDVANVHDNNDNNEAERFNDNPQINFPFHLFDALFQEPQNQHPTEYGAATSGESSESSSSSSGLSGRPSVMTMSPLSRMSLERIFDPEGSTTTTEAELDWDNNSLTVNLSNPLERIRMFSLSSYATESDNDSVFDPVLFVPPSPDSPPSPYVRVTRNLLREGEFVRASQMGPFVSARASDSSTGPESPFLRQNPLRRPLRVRTVLESSPIADRDRSAASQSAGASRQRLASIRESTSE